MSTCDNTIKQLKPETTFLDSPQDRTNQQRTKKKKHCIIGWFPHCLNWKKMMKN